MTFNIEALYVILLVRFRKELKKKQRKNDQYHFTTDANAKKLSIQREPNTSL